jgi:hypothetical protein
MKTFIANFGTENWAWKNCLERSSIAVMDDMRVHPYWQRSDREGYIAEAQEKLISRMGRPVARQAASRWFNLNTILMETDGDIWIHREKDELWWTTSLGNAPESEIVDDPQYHSERVKIIVYYKLCQAWSNKTTKGGKLPPWAGIHPKAREFLFTEGTFQQLSADNSLYAQALIYGDSLSDWHQRPDWRAKEDRAGSGAGTVFNPLELTAARMLLDLTAERMAETAQATATQSGQVSVVITKEKKFLFAEQRDLEANAVELFKSQEGLCALTGLEMLLDGVDGDHQLRCSLDRIDSSGHYERGNLQVVCKFANRWKCASDNEEFKRLISLISRQE